MKIKVGLPYRLNADAKIKYKVRRRNEGYDGYLRVKSKSKKSLVKFNCETGISRSTAEDVVKDLMELQVKLLFGTVEVSGYERYERVLEDKGKPTPQHETEVKKWT